MEGVECFWRHLHPNRCWGIDWSSWQWYDVFPWVLSRVSFSNVKMAGGLFYYINCCFISVFTPMFGIIVENDSFLSRKKILGSYALNIYYLIQYLFMSSPGYVYYWFWIAHCLLVLVQLFCYFITRSWCARASCLCLYMQVQCFVI